MEEIEKKDLLNKNYRIRCVMNYMRKRYYKRRKETAHGRIGL